MLRLRLTPHTLHFKRPAPTSRGPLATRAIWLVHAVDTRRTQSIGLGECGPVQGLSIDDHADFAAHAQTLIHAINSAALEVWPAEDWVTFLDSLLAPWDAQLARLPSLRFGVESALLDLHNGGPGVLFDSAFTRGAACLPTHGLIWMDTPEGLFAQVDAKVAAGFDVIKMKVGALPFGDELALLRTLRARFPNITLRLDANGAFAPSEALQRLEALAPLQVEFIEQPIRAGQLVHMAALCASSPIPIALDEELIGLASAGALNNLLAQVRPQGIVIKPTLLGGWRATADAVSACEKSSTAWWANSLLEASIGHDAICQWTAAYGGERLHGLGTGALFSNNFPSPVTLVGSQLRRNATAARQIHRALAASQARWST